MSLRAAWERKAEAWVETVRGAGDPFFGHNGARFLDLLPPPGRATLDLGCGEGRVGALLRERGHRVIGVDASPTLVRYARERMEALEADATALPFADETFDLVVAFVSLHDMDDMPGAVAEAARVLEPSGRLCLAMSHPFLPSLEGRVAAYLVSTPDVDKWPSAHHPLETYARALESAAFVIEDLHEVPGVRRPHVPIALHVRAVKR